MTILAVHMGEDWPRLLVVPPGRDFHEDLESWTGNIPEGRYGSLQRHLLGLGYRDLPDVVWVDETARPGERIHRDPWGEDDG